MSDRQDQDLDELLSRHLHACLDGQLGRAAEALHEELSPRWRWRLWLSAATAVAAGLTVALIMIFHHPSIPKSPIVELPLTDESVPPMVQSASWSKMMDDGTTLVDARPMRKMRRKIVEEVEWYDARDGAMVKTTIPRQQIFMIEIKTD